MAGMVDRHAAELQDGDEVVLLGRTLTFGKKNSGLVLEKSLAEDGRVHLLLSVDPEADLVTSARPREEDTPFDEVDTVVEDTFDTGAGNVTVVDMAPVVDLDESAGLPE